MGESKSVQGRGMSVSVIIQLILGFSALGYLYRGDAYFMPYLLAAAVGLFCLVQNIRLHSGVKGKERLAWHVYAAPLIYALAVTGANYTLWTGISYPDTIGVSVRFLHQAWLVCAIFLGSYFPAFQIVQYLNRVKAGEKGLDADGGSNADAGAAANARAAAEAGQNMPDAGRMRTAWVAFAVPFILISAVDIAILFLCRYPGVISADSLTQIKQSLGNWYNNHHPYYHTQLIHLFLIIGLKLIGDLNAAVALYHVFQILFMAACFSAAVMTTYEMGLSRKAVVLTSLFYILMPFHINYSFTMWKDVMFGGFVLLFAVFTVRSLKGIGGKRKNAVLLFLSGVGVCLFRSNGFIMFLIVVLVFLLLYRKDIAAGLKNRKKKNASIAETGDIVSGDAARRADAARRSLAVAGVFAAVIVVSYILKHPVLAALDVRQPDTAEMLSIPLQQITRTAAEYDDLSEDDIGALECFVSVQRMREQYSPYYSDPVKNLIREEGDLSYLQSHLPMFFRTYISIGLQHPDTYLKAWVDQTKGYWNSGYEYWRWLDLVSNEEEYDLYRTVRSDFVYRHFEEYLWLFQTNAVLVLFLCIGLYVWIDWLALYWFFVRGDKAGMVIAMLIVAMVFTLQISAPVYSEFRYAYSAFCVLPFVVLTALRRE